MRNLPRDSATTRIYYRIFLVSPHHRPQPSLVKAMVEKAACSGWGKIYFTTSATDDQDQNPWNEHTLFWHDLVTEVSLDIDITCPDSDQSQMRIMVPLLPSPVPDADGACVTLLFSPRCSGGKISSSCCGCTDIVFP